MSISLTSSLLFVVFALSATITYGMRMHALHFNLLDHPNERSSHIEPTPSGGGLAVAVIFILCTVLLYFLDQIPSNQAIAMSGAGLAVAGIGLWDDHHQISRTSRFLIHLGAGCWAIMWIGGLPPIPLWEWVWEPGFIGNTVAVLGIVWLLNLFNFMDGIDGIAGLETITVTGGAAVLLYMTNQGSHIVWPLTILAATAGFLVWNWPPARIFMGDVGSGFIGIALGIMAISISAESGLNLWCWGILMAVFVTDATFTLIRRILKGERWYQAHRSHAYQLLSQYAGRHWPVTVGVGLINVVWLLPLSWIAAVQPSFSLWIAFLAYLPLIVAAFWITNNLSNSDNIGTMLDRI